MEQELTKLQRDVDFLKREIDQMNTSRKEQRHNGVDGRLVDFNYLDGLITVVTSSSELTARTSGIARTVGEQIFIHYNSTGPVWKLYLYDNVNNVWKNVTIA